jgi:arsenate reductase
VSLLEQSGVEFTKVEYLKNPLNRNEILSLSNKLGMAPSGFVRKNEASYKENNFGEILNDDQMMAEAMEKFPKMMERPIAVKGKKAIIGRPPENVLTLLD